MDYQWLLESMGDAVIGLDASGKIILWNAAAETTYGWTKEEVIGKPLAGLLSTRYDDPLETSQRARDTVISKGVWRGKVYQQRKDGSQVVIDSTVSTYPITDGKRGLVAINRDITEKDRLEKAIRRLEYLNRVLLRLPTLDEVFQTYVLQTREILLFDRLELWLLNEKTNLVQVSKRYFRNQFVFSPLQSCPVRETPLGVVKYIRTALIIPDLQNQPHFTQKGLTDPADRALMVIPLILNDSVIGGVAFFSTVPDLFQSSIADLLTATTEQLALAIHQIQLMQSLKYQVQENSRLLHLSQEDSRQLQAVSAILMRLQEREREHLSREFHDEIGQSLTALFLNLRSIRQECADWKPLVLEPLDECIKLASHLIEQVRTLSLELYPKILEDLGFIPAMRWLLDRAKKFGKIQIDFTPPSSSFPMARDLEFGIFRITQETITNILRHANARKISVHFQQNTGSGELVISDDGQGFEANFTSSAGLPAHYFGIHSMFARARLIGADLQILSSLNQGTVVTLRWNYETEPAENPPG